MTMKTLCEQCKNEFETELEYNPLDSNGRTVTIISVCPDCEELSKDEDF